MRLTTLWRRYEWLPLVLFSTAITLAIGFIFQTVVLYDEALNNERERSAIIDKGLTVSSQLESQINSIVFLANGLAAMIAATPDISTQSINLSLQILHQSNPGLKNIAVAPHNVIRFVYPLEGNQQAIGLDYRQTPAQWPLIARSIKEKRTIVAGPIVLKQGGNGFVSRTPVFMHDGTQWGMVSLVLDSDQLLQQVADKAQGLDLEMSIRGRNGEGERGEIFFGQPDLFQQNPYLMNVRIPGGSWQLAFRPLGSNPADAANSRMHGQIIAGWVVACLVGLLSFLFLRSQQTIKSDGKKFRSILESTKDAIIISDDRGMIETINRSAADMFGYAMDELRGQSLNILMQAEDAAQHDSHLHDHTSTVPIRMASNREITGLRKDGSTFPLEVNVSSFTIAGRKRFSGIMRDISERMKTQARLLEMANTDYLTKTLNRRAFMEILEQQSQLAQSQESALSMLLLDIDHFKSVNDNYGHDSGDVVLIELARRISSQLRPTDTLGRLGGEEFAILLPETGVDAALQTAQELVRTIAAQPIPLRSHQAIHVTVSIGVAALGQHCKNSQELLIDADQLLYQAKRSGRNQAIAASRKPAAH